MAEERFLIAPFDKGSQSNVKPWLLMDEAWALQRNMYTWRGSIKKRFGSRYMNDSKVSLLQQLFSRLRMQVGTIDAGTGLGAGTVPGSVFKIGQQFSIIDNNGAVGTVIFTVWQAAGAMLTTDATRTGTYDTATGVFAFAGFTHFASPILWYPAEPVMKLATYATNAINDEVLVALDTQFAYKFSYAAGWSCLGPVPSPRGVATVAGSAEWSPGGVAPHATDAHFYWTTNYRSNLAQNWSLFVTNNTPYSTAGAGVHELDGIKYWDGANWTTIGTAATMPINIVAGPVTTFITTCGVIIQYKGRLLLEDVTLVTTGVAGTIRYPNAMFYSQVGNAVDPLSWRQDIPGRGGFNNAPVQQTIIGAEFLKDQLINYMEDSTWEIVFTDNQLAPFKFQQINTELGVESSASIVPFDKAVLGIGPVGIHACNGLNVQRIDEIIPYTVFDIANGNLGPQRVNGVRDYYLELVYWSYPSSDTQPTSANIFPNRVIVYDYINSTWAYNDDSITALGNYQFQFTQTWADIDATWAEMETAWANTVGTERFRSVIAGNQEGFTFIVDSTRSYNARVLSITQIAIVNDLITLTVIDHNLIAGSYIFIDNIQSTGTLPTLNASDPATLGGIYQIGVGTGYNTIFLVNVPVLTGTYAGGGTIARVSEPQLISKQYNFYTKLGQNIASNRIDFYVDKTSSGEITIDYYVSASELLLLEDSVATGALLGTSVLSTVASPLNPLETTQTRFWHSVYFQAQGENIQLNMYLSPAQMLDRNISLSDFQLNAMLFHVTKTSDFGS